MKNVQYVVVFSWLSILNPIYNLVIFIFFHKLMIDSKGTGKGNITLIA